MAITSGHAHTNNHNASAGPQLGRECRCARAFSRRSGGIMATSGVGSGAALFIESISGAKCHLFSLMSRDSTPKSLS